VPSPDIQIRHGQFTDLTGPPQRHGDMTFAPAEIRLHGSMFDLTHSLEDHLKRMDVSPETKTLVRPGEDAVWVRGRAQQLFMIPNTTEEDRGEKAFFFASFLALIEGEDDRYVGIPFECSDYYGRSELIFSSEDSPPLEVQDRIANAFWSLLLSEPDAIADYRDSVLHHGAGVWLDFGVQDGEPFLEERT
jgi:hypothetical protein